MADVFATIVTPAEYRDDAIALSQGTLAFSAAFTTDPQGLPPATHYMASGFIPEEVKAAFEADARFVVSEEHWRVVATSMGLYRVV